MTKRALTRNELKSLGLNSTEIEKALSLQRERKEREYKYIALLTSAEADALSKQTGKDFVRATEYKSEKNR